MASTYQIAPEHVKELVLRIMREHHGELHDFKVTIDVLCAYADPETLDPAVKAHGYPALATVRKIGLKDRVKGCGDAEIVLDGDQLETWDERELCAIIDHELTHLELQRDKEGGVKYDDLGRPLLRIRLHDIQFGWFDSVARRWGDDSQEVKQAKGLCGDWEFVQLYLPGFRGSDLGRIKAEKKKESEDADARNGETSSYVEKATSKSPKSGAKKPAMAGA